MVTRPLHQFLREKMTEIRFIVGTGRSGTRTMFRMLTGSDGVEIHHEYNVLPVQKIGVLYHSGKITREECKSKISEIYNPAIAHSSDSLWIDSSNKCAWIIDILAELYPSAKFLNLVRDGRKVVPSFYYKLREEMYDDLSTLRTTEFLEDNNNQKSVLPLEKKYWWYVPVNNPEEFTVFKRYNRFERCCYHWNYVNSLVLKAFNNINPENCMTSKLEDLVSNEEELKRVLTFFGVDHDPIYTEYLKTPRNVFHPLDYQIPIKFKKSFKSICSPMMVKLGYENREGYKVDY